MRKIGAGLRVKGWGKFFHDLFLVITFPIRKPLILIPILMIGYLAPTFMGAKPTEVHLWYFNKIKSKISGVSSALSLPQVDFISDVNNIKKTVSSLTELVATAEKVDKDTTVEFIKTPENNLSQSEIRRKIFEKAKQAPDTVDVLKTLQRQQKVAEYAKNAENNNATETKTEKKLPLNYVLTQENIQGHAQVKNANEIIVNGVRYFLHGIYVNPNTGKGLQAKALLEKVIAENIIKCKIIAYTYQNVGTIDCQVNGENINRLLVEQGYSKNVDLQ